MNKLESIEEVEQLPAKQPEEGELLPKNSPFVINSPSISRSKPVHSYRNSVDLNTKVTPRSKKRLSLIINSVSGQNEYNQMPKSMDNSLDLEKQKFEIKEFKEIQYNNKSTSAPVTSNNNLKLSFDEDVTKDSKDYISGTDFAHLVVKSNNTREEEDNTIEHEMNGQEEKRSPIPPKLPARTRFLTNNNNQDSTETLNINKGEEDLNSNYSFNIVSPTLSPTLLEHENTPKLTKMLEEMALSPEDDQKQKLVFDLVTNFSKLEIGAEPIWERIKQSVNSSKVVTRFLRRCAAVDEEYGKNLMKCVNTTLKEIEKEESQNGTFSDSMNEILKLHEEIAKSKIRLASHTYSIAEELAYVAKEKDTLRKMQRETGTKIKKTLMDGEYNLEKIKGRYLQATETWEKAILTRIEQSQMELEQPIQNQLPSRPHNPIMEAINNIFTQPRSVDSLKKAEEEAKTKAVNAKRLYSQNVNVLNHIKHEYYNQQLPDLIKESVSCVEESDKACKVYLDLFANRSMAGYNEVNNLIANEEKGLNKLIQKIDFHQDNLEYFAKFLKNQPANRDPFSMLDYSMSPLAQSALNPKVVYGVDLIKLAERDNLDMPIMVEKCINYIEDKGITFEGIYRRSGASTKINRLKELFNLNSENVDLENLEIAQDVDSVTGALKLFLRELPNATVPSNYWSQFYTAYKLENSSHEEKVHAYLQAINNLPAPHRNLLRKLVMHLKKVSQYENENKMTVSNLAIVFGPTLFEPAYNSNAVETMGFQCGVTMDLLNFEELLFED